MTALSRSISIPEAAKMLDMTEAELQQMLADKKIQPGDRKCIPAAFYLLQTEAVREALNKARSRDGLQ